MLNALKKARLTAGVTQTDLAAQLGVTSGAVGQWEKGLTKPRPNRLKQIAQILGTTVDEIISDWGE